VAKTTKTKHTLNIMIITKTSKFSTAEMPQKISKIGQWRRKHPRGLEGIVINDPRILDGLSILDILKFRQNEILN